MPFISYERHFYMLFSLNFDPAGTETAFLLKLVLKYKSF
jgi:hypothetical protein